ncbi:hypothetical protein EMIHUDRAFT_209500 [Emiliania huxleyi CCMP1516]|uniref:Uncharacterized protein n=2 Tax=Emiliania huxleyi TaxID=2903 RepID=A0A0D3J5T5_EMIH1|nr:hypothetical protein EMIHUDRAFT_209500 [Emiliania huxleyi CCMP1516]EOD18870.1 hypothetical protein EMIHUDRAFT_209500 [Emiliania huxleyi CCMP1516]|eukprot:XP_005771299.1 hypothetical protein EMIHUDRAFT_209500 [Emiliania huxleyi CCMP1516]
MTTLNLGGNYIRAEGAAAISEALRGNGVLKELNLCANSIGPTGATALADALKVNGVLTKIVLWGNNLGDEGKGVIRDAEAATDERVGLSYSLRTKNAAQRTVRGVQPS